MADKKTLELQIQVLMQQAQQQIKTFATEIKSASEQIKNLNTNNSAVKKSIESVQAEANRAAKELNNFANEGAFSVKNLVKEIGNLATVTAAVSFDKWVAGLAGSALSASTSFRAAKEDFGIMLGDMEAGAGLFAELQEFNFWTPFDLEQTSQAAKVLMAAKVPLAEITDYLTTFGDIAQGNGQRFQSFINAFSKASAKGKADMEVLNVYIDQGVQILDALGEQMGVTSAEIVDMASKGQVSFQDLDNALASLAAEGGLYYNSMATASQRLDAMQAGLKESVNALAASFGDMLAPVIAKVLETITNLVDAINNSPFLKGILAGALSAIVVIINTQMIRALVAFIAKTWAAYASQMALNSAMSITNPLLLAGITAVGVATAGYVAYAASQQEAAEATNEQALALQQAAQEADTYAESLKNLSIEQLNYTSTEIQTQLMETQRILNEEQRKLWSIPKRVKTDYYDPLHQDENGLIENQYYAQQENIVNSLASAIDNLNLKLQLIEKTKEDIELDEFNKELEESNKIIAWRDSLFAKTREGQIEALEKELEKVKELYTLETLEETGDYTGFNDQKTDAIVAHLEEQIANLKNKTEKAAEELGNTWAEKNLEGLEKLYAAQEKSIEELKEKAQKAYGSEFETQATYQKELAELKKYYNKQIASEEENFYKSFHEMRMQQLADEAAVAMGKGLIQAENGNVSGILQVAGATAQTAIANTDIGAIAMSSTGLGSALGPLALFAEALTSSVMSLESVQKILNVFSTILTPMMAILEPFVNAILAPIIEVLETLGKTLGLILAPAMAILQAVLAILPVFRILTAVLQVVANAFKWFYEKVIMPVGNAIIDTANAIIGLLNKIPGVDIDKLGRLEKVGEIADEMASAFEAQAESVRRQFQAQEDKVNDLLRAQLNSIQTQYELGLISREEYEAKAQGYQQEADKELIELNQLQAKILAQIEANTYAAATGNTTDLAEKRKSYAESLGEKWGESAGFLGNLAGSIVGGIADVATATWDVVTDVATSIGEGISNAWDGLGDWLGWWDVGSPNIPFDHLAMVHKGETIIPRTFADGIRSGELSLVGKNSNQNTSPIVVNISVGGSIVTEQEITDLVYNGIAKGIQTRNYQPLPGAI